MLMLCCLNYFGYLCCLCFRYFKSVIFIVCVFLGFTANAVLNHDLVQTSLLQQQKNVYKSSLTGWFSEKCSGVASSVSRIISFPYMSDDCELNRSTFNHFNSHCMLDDNQLYSILESFKGEESIEVLALVYIQALVNIDELYQALGNNKLPVPEWFLVHQRNLQRLKCVNNLFININHTRNAKVIELLTNESCQSIIDIEGEINSYFYLFQALMQCHKNINEPDSSIWQELNKQVNKIVDSAKNGRGLSKEVCAQSELLLNALAKVYIVEGHQMPLCPLMYAFSSWCKCYTHEEISKLLADSDNYCSADNSQIEDQNN